MGKLVKPLGSIERHLHKNEILDLATQSADAIIESGKYDLLKVYVELKRYEAYLKGIIDKLKNPALDKATESGEKSFKYNEANVNISKRTKWDFSVDDQWREIDQEIRNLLKEKKERENLLKESNETHSILDKNTGELIENFELPKEIVYGLTIRL